MRNRLLDVALGPVAGSAGLAAGHLTAAVTTAQASPVLAVGSAVIDRTPTPLKEWAIAHFGAHDKTVLIGSVLVVVLAVTTAIGPLARRRRPLGVAAMLLLPAIAAAAALTRPTAGITDLAPSVVTAAVASLTLVLLLDAPVVDGAATTAAGRPDRRTVLALGALAVIALAIGEAGRAVMRYRSRPEDVTLPVPRSPAPDLPAGIERMVPGVTPFRTANGRFYRVDTRLDVPVIATDGWRLSVDGDVAHPFTIGYDDLLAMPMIERDITLTCVSNSVGGPYAGGARWLGIPLRDLLDRAGVGHHADQILSTDVDGMTISTPLALAADGRDALVAVGMNGVPLPREHGFPARLVIPGLYGFISATKWLRRLTLTSYAERSSYWTDRGWATDAPIKISSRIDTPRPLQQVPAGDVVIGGVAWAQQHGGVARVEVQIDGGRWRVAELGPSGGNDYWRQWYLRWPATAGQHTLACRVTDGAGEVQTAVRANPFPNGASGLHTIVVTAG
jgi:DMSO/TMAO reductase YedYZ molybdopterin-dependent catalytic subunit